MIEKSNFMVSQKHIAEEVLLASNLHIPAFGENDLCSAQLPIQLNNVMVYQEGA